MPRRYPATLKWSFLNQFNPHPPFISCTQSHPISQDDEGPSDSSCAPRSISCTQRGKTGNRLLFGQRIEQKAHTSQSQFEPVVLLCSPPASLLSWRKDKKNIIDSNLWPSNQERTCEGEWFADEGDIKETKPG